MFVNDWENEGVSKIIEDWDAPADALEGATILMASYTYEDYSGSGYVLFVKDGKFYEVHGSHCSCYGLGGFDGDTWEPEECTLEELYVLIEKRDNYEFHGEYNKESTLKQIQRYLDGELKETKPYVLTP